MVSLVTSSFSVFFLYSLLSTKTYSFLRFGIFSLSGHFDSSKKKISSLIFELIRTMIIIYRISKNHLFSAFNLFYFLSIIIAAWLPSVNAFTHTPTNRCGHGDLFLLTILFTTIPCPLLGCGV